MQPRKPMKKLTVQPKPQQSYEEAKRKAQLEESLALMMENIDEEIDRQVGEILKEFGYDYKEDGSLEDHQALAQEMESNGHRVAISGDMEGSTYVVRIDLTQRVRELRFDLEKED